MAAPVNMNTVNNSYYQPVYHGRGQVYDQNGYAVTQHPAPAEAAKAQNNFLHASVCVPAGSIARPVDSSPSKTSVTETSTNSDFAEVELNSNGGLCRAFWYLTLRDGPMIAENREKQVQLDYLTSCVMRWTVFPMIFQTIFLVFLAKFNFDGFPEDDQIHDGWTRVTCVFAIAIHLWSMTNFFFNDLLRQYRIIRGARNIMHCDSRFIAWVLFLWETAIFLALIVLGSCFLAKSEAPIDAILNCLALEFILTIDNYVADFQTVTGGIQTAYVPVDTVLPESNKDWLGCSRVWVCIALNLVVTPIIPIGVGWVVCLLMDRGIVEVGDDDIPVDAIIFGTLLVILVLSFRGCLDYLCCCCLKKGRENTDSSSSEALYGLRSAPGDAAHL